MKKNNPILIVLAIGLAILAGQLTINQQPGAPTQVGQPQGSLRRVMEVSDGDTVKLDGGEKVRLIGIDTPETHDNPKLSRDVQKRRSSKSVQLALGKKAAHYVRSFLEGQEVRLEYDVEPKDRYGRTLGYLYLTDGTFVNDKIIRDGYAYPLTIPPNVRYADRFVRSFDEARDQKRGLWR